MFSKKEAPPEASTDTSAPAVLPTVDEHARETGNLKPTRFGFFTAGRPEQRVLPSDLHAAAAALHGWNQHAHHAGEQFRCTREAYLAALKAAGEPVTRSLGPDGKPGAPLTAEDVAKLNGTKPTVTDYEPHTAALSPYAPKSEA